MKLSCLLAIFGAASGLLQRVASPVSVRRAAAPRMAASTDSWLKLPMEPDPELNMIDSIRVVCTGLEFNDYPTVDAGVVRLYNWLTPQGRVALAPPPPVSGTQTGVTLEYFLEHAGGAALGALLSCSHWDCVGEARVMPPTNAHGALATQMIEVGDIPPPPLQVEARAESFSNAAHHALSHTVLFCIPYPAASACPAPMPCSLALGLPTPLPVPQMKRTSPCPALGFRQAPAPPALRQSEASPEPRPLPLAEIQRTEAMAGGWSGGRKGT
jgi:hypothetical protein